MLRLFVVFLPFDVWGWIAAMGEDGDDTAKICPLHSSNKFESRFSARNFWLRNFLPRSILIGYRHMTHV